MPRKKTPDFEASIKELERLVEQMEEGDLGLEESLKQFERGIALSRSCQKALEAAEQKVQKLVERDGHEELEDFEPDFEPQDD